MSHVQIRYSVRSPPDELRPWVQCLWTFEARDLKEVPYEHYVPPDGCVSLLRNLNPCLSVDPIVIVGPRWEPTLVPIHSGDHYQGIRFWPHAARTLLGTKLDEMVGKIAPIREMALELANQIEPQIPDNTSCLANWRGAVLKELTTVLPLGCSVDPLARIAAESIALTNGQVVIAEFAKNQGVSLRQLQRRFSQATGLRLKQFARICRFREAAREIIRAEPRPWCQVAMDAGFSDQAHMTREFVQLIGLAPKQMQTTYEAIFHESVDPPL